MRIQIGPEGNVILVHTFAARRIRVDQARSDLTESTVGRLPTRTGSVTLSKFLTLPEGLIFRTVLDVD